MMRGHCYKLMVAVVVTLLHHMMVLAMDDNAVVHEYFDVIPGGGTYEHEVHFNAEGLSCVFKYSCMGGTKEEWVMTITKDNHDDYMCKVERHEGLESYLYFHDFEVKVTGGQLLDGVIFSKNPNEIADESEFILKRDSNSITNSNSFKNGLHRAFAVFNKKGTPEINKKGKNEL